MRTRVVALALMLASCGDRTPRDEGAWNAVVPVVPSSSPAVVDVRTPPEALRREIDRLSTLVDGPVAISVRDLDEGWSVRAGTDVPLPQQSVSKLWVAFTVYSMVDQGSLRLSDPVTVRRGDLTLFHQPIAALVGSSGYDTTVRGLLVRALTQSDNTANDRLLTLVGGPAAVRRALARAGIEGVAFGPGERLLQSGTAGVPWRDGDTASTFERLRAALAPQLRTAAYRRYVAAPPDGARATAITGALGLMRAGRALARSSAIDLFGIMSRTRTGHARLRAGVPRGWLVAHKTGTGQTYAGRTAGFNDVGILLSPDRHAYAVAVMIGDSSSGARAGQHLIAGVARAVADAHAARHPTTAWETR
jgi:beta-lactamase class A